MKNSLLFTLHSLYSSLLAHKKEHIRKFAAESFSFLMRKVSHLHARRQQSRRAHFPHVVLQRVSPCVKQVPDIDSLLSHVFLDLQQHPEKAEGAGQLLFEMCKGVRNMFHSCAEKVRIFFVFFTANFIFKVSLQRAKMNEIKSDFLFELLYIIKKSLI